MIRSMTGFARGEEGNGEMKCLIEIRSVNHRFLDCNVRLSSKYFELEKKIKDAVSACLSRGSVEVAISFSEPENGAKKLVVNKAMVEQYLAASKQLLADYPIYGELDLLTLLANKDVFKYEEPEVDSAKREQLIFGTIKTVLKRLVKMREVEGDALKKDLLEKIENIDASRTAIEKVAEKHKNGLAKKMKTRFKEIIADCDIDENRVLAEVAIYADRCDIAEELSRLASHLNQVRELLSTGGVVGRKIEFIAQELNREANTIGSKSGAFDISREVIEIKSNLEKIREQSANIE